MSACAPRTMASDGFSASSVSGSAVPGVSAPAKSGPMLASIALGDRWAHLNGGAFVVEEKVQEVKAFATDSAHESRLWDATLELLDVER